MLISIAEWISGDVNLNAKWNFGVANNVAYHKISRQHQQIFSESNDRAEWGSFVRPSKTLATTITNTFSTIPPMSEMDLRINPVLKALFEAAL